MDLTADELRMEGYISYLSEIVDSCVHTVRKAEYRMSNADMVVCLINGLAVVRQENMGTAISLACSQNA
jgi:hypothetical protein